MERFENQVAVVIGGARGIGRAITERLVQEGAKVSVFDVLKEDLEKFGELNGVTRAVEVDITDEEHLNEAV